MTWNGEKKNVLITSDVSCKVLKCSNSKNIFGHTCSYIWFFNNRNQQKCLLIDIICVAVVAQMNVKKYAIVHAIWSPAKSLNSSCQRKWQKYEKKPTRWIANDSWLISKAILPWVRPSIYIYKWLIEQNNNNHNEMK